MPEGHTIHRLARDHGRWFAGQTVHVSSPQGRFSDAAGAVDGQPLRAVEAHGKHLFYRFDDYSVHVHLGLYGRYRMFKLPAGEPRGAVRMLLRGDEREVHLIGPTACELLLPDQHDAILDRLGPDPLQEDADKEAVWAKLQRSRRPIGAMLMDQKIVAGIGNVYRAELLFLAGVWPWLPSKALPRDRFDQIWDDAVRLLSLGVRINRIVTVPPEVTGTAPSKTPRAKAVYVYKRRVCQVCGSEITWGEMANRKVYACPTCQPLGRDR